MTCFLEISRSVIMAFVAWAVAMCCFLKVVRFAVKPSIVVWTDIVSRLLKVFRSILDGLTCRWAASGLLHVENGGLGRSD